MKTLSVENKISYWWKRDDGKPIKPNHVEALKESADERIGASLKEGYTSGQLLDCIRMTDKDGEDGISYQGWWEIKTL